MQKCTFLNNPQIKKDGPHAGGRLLPYDWQLFNRSYQELEGFRLVHGEVGEHLAIEADAFLAQLVNKGGIGQAFCADGGIDTGDPQCAVFPFLQFAADITILKALFEDVLGDGVYIFTFAVKTFGLFQDAFSAGAGSDGVN